jgi:hypothetical protein
VALLAHNIRTAHDPVVRRCPYSEWRRGGPCRHCIDAPTLPPSLLSVVTRARLRHGADVHRGRPGRGLPGLPPRLLHPPRVRPPHGGRGSAWAGGGAPPRGRVRQLLFPSSRPTAGAAAVLRLNTPTPRIGHWYPRRPSTHAPGRRRATGSGATPPHTPSTVSDTVALDPTPAAFTPAATPSSHPYPLFRVRPALHGTPHHATATHPIPPPPPPRNTCGLQVCHDTLQQPLSPPTCLPSATQHPTRRYPHLPPPPPTPSSHAGRHTLACRATTTSCWRSSGGTTVRTGRVRGAWRVRQCTLPVCAELGGLGRLCPGCHTLIDRNGGCNHMRCAPLPCPPPPCSSAILPLPLTFGRCTRCGTHFCWACMHAHGACSDDGVGVVGCGVHTPCVVRRDTRVLCTVTHTRRCGRHGAALCLVEHLRQHLLWPADGAGRRR